ncbi:hypothetical protein BC941DRAFT_169825 [Chlamydoabsidia padenii]|nr:hypothetical protein BC941DRAFT_169825 [Chlamydoabsidia padenii]
MNSSAPVNAGHSYANTAEGYEDREAWHEAIEAHQKAAEQFKKALDYTQDPEAGKSLRLLVANHTRRAKDLERKVAKSEQEQRRHEELATCRANGQNDIKMDELLHALASTGIQGRTDKNKGYDSLHHGTIGESYALLSTDNDEEEDDDASDPFNKFLQVVETLVDQLSNPVAFASAPLNEDDTPYHQKLLSDDSDAMMESFFLIPDRSLDLQAENEQLKHRVEHLSRRVQSLEKAAEESSMLKSSILQFKHDVQRQAKRIMQTQDPMRSSSAALLGSINVTHPSRHPSSTAELVTRLKETEDENRRLKDQIDKQQVLMTKYRERWEKLKESAKKRRAQPSDNATDPQRSPYSSRPPAFLRSLAQQHHHPPFASSSLARSNPIVSEDP